MRTPTVPIEPPYAGQRRGRRNWTGGLVILTLSFNAAYVTPVYALRLLEARTCCTQSCHHLPRPGHPGCCCKLVKASVDVAVKSASPSPAHPASSFVSAHHGSVYHHGSAVTMHLALLTTRAAPLYLFDCVLRL